MTRRPTRSSIERDLDDLGSGDGDEPPWDVSTAYRMREGWVDDGEPVPEDATVLLRISGVTMEPKQAERDGYEILGPVETPDPTEYVRIPWGLLRQRGSIHK